MNKCKFAFDQQDPLCKNCDGLTIKVGDEVLESICCMDFQPEEPTQSTENEVDNIEEVETHTETQETVQLTTVNTVNNTNTLPIDNPPLNNGYERDTGYRVKSLSYSSSVTIKKGDTYYKFSAQEEWELNENCVVEEVREKLWDKINSEVDYQAEEILKS